MNIYETTCRLRRLVTHAWRLISCTSLCISVLQWVMRQLCKSDPLCCRSHITVHSALLRTFSSNQITMTSTTMACWEDQCSKDQQAQDKLPSNSHGARLDLTCCWKPESTFTALVWIVSQGVCWLDAICLFPSDGFLSFFVTPNNEIFKRGVIFIMNNFFTKWVLKEKAYQTTQVRRSAVLDFFFFVSNGVKQAVFLIMNLFFCIQIVTIFPPCCVTDVEYKLLTRSWLWHKIIDYIIIRRG